jgi:hypothetical protein
LGIFEVGGAKAKVFGRLDDCCDVGGLYLRIEGSLELLFPFLLVGEAPVPYLLVHIA